MLRPRLPVRGDQHVQLEALAKSVFRAKAKAQYDLDLVVGAATASARAHQKCFEMLPEISVCFVMQSAGGSYGLIVFDGATVDALIEQQTLGRVASAPRGDRPITQIDARLSEDFATISVEAIGAGLAEASLPDIAALVVTHAEFDRKNLALVLGAELYDVLDIELDFGPGIKTGCVQIWYPAPTPAQSDAEGALVAASVDPQLARILNDVPATLVAQIEGVKVPLQDFLALAPDALIELPPDVLSEVALCDVSGGRVARARLGQLNGKSAVRVLGLAGHEDDAEMGVGDDLSSGDLMQADDMAPALPNIEMGMGAGDLGGTADAALPEVGMAGGDMDLPAMDGAMMETAPLDGLGDGLGDAPAIDMGEALPDLPADLDMDFPAAAPLDLSDGEDATEDDGFPAMATIAIE